MKQTGTHYQVLSIGDVSKLGRVTLHGELGLTGSEISINELSAGVSIPFVHRNKRNEEVYLILKGKGQFFVDGDVFEVDEGCAVRIDSAGARCLKADSQTPIRYICIQTEAKSLVQFTENDGVMVESKPTWLK